MTEFRPDIQGLRAIAVVGVLLFHVNPHLVSGGFVGVDVFFVISGFLITKIIWRDLSTDVFTFQGFYARRIKRLYPALVAMLIGTSIGTCVFALPDESRTYALSMISSMFYVSNMFFLSQTDYFASDLELNTLLHTWSLSVEEQFYLVYPLLIVLIFKFWRIRAVVIVAAFGLASLVLSEMLIEWHQRVSFFAAPSRFFQFVAGALIALNPDAIRLVSRKMLAPIAWVGLTMVIASVVFYTGSMRFPGIAALLPTLGTAAMIFAGQVPGQSCSKMLSNPVLMFFGEISYSLYLWHWPIVTFYKVSISPNVSYVEQTFLVALSVVFGYLSWRFVEMPFRRMQFTSTRNIWYSGLIATLALTLAGVWIYASGGLAMGFSSKQLAVAEYLDYYPERNRRGTCFITSESPDDQAVLDDECVVTDDTMPNILLIGDSHAAHFFGALNDLLPEVLFSQVTASGCRPTIEYGGSPRCTELMQYAIEDLLPSGDFQGVIISGRWRSEDIAALVRTVEQLSKLNIVVIVLGPIISYDQALPRLLSRFDRISGYDSKIRSAQNYSDARQLDVTIRSALAETKGVYISILDAICPHGRCDVYAKSGVPMQWDTAHLTHEGAIKLVEGIRGDIKVSIEKREASADVARP